jgi:membrane fusion protein, heavy metal efflux system
MHTESPGFLFIMAVLLIISSCSRTIKHSANNIDSTGKVKAVYLLPKNIHQLNLRFGQIEAKIINHDIVGKGTVIIPPENMYSITAPVNGKISGLNIQSKQEIKKGQLIAGIQNIDFITLQQEYLEAKNQYEYYKNEYIRQGELTVENATTIKNMQAARRDYQTTELKFNALSLKLKLWGINPETLSMDNLISNIPIHSDLQGIISQIYIQNGSYVQPGDPLLDMILDSRVQIKIFVEESNFNQFQEGQSVDCFLPPDSLTLIKASICSFQPQIDPISQTAIIYASFQDAQPELVPGMTVHCKIHTTMDSVKVICSSAVIKDGQDYVVFVKHNGKFFRVPVLTGFFSETLTEIYGMPDNMSDSIIIYNAKRLKTYFN